MMAWTKAAVIGLAGVAFGLGGCLGGTTVERRDPAPAPAPVTDRPTQPSNQPPLTKPAPTVDRAGEAARQFRGTLKGGIVNSGAEGTGWVLERAQGRPTLDVDISKIAKAAEKFDGKSVIIGGRIVEKKYPQRGIVRTLVAESITEQAVQRY